MIGSKMEELIIELNKASELYYNGQESFLTDKEFDDKLNELKELEQKSKIIYSNSPTINVGSPVLSELKKINIQDKPMLSLDKVHSADEIIKFFDGYDLVASIKCDGLSVRLVYENTDLVSANTRGNGYIGADITEHIKHFLNVPIKIKTPKRFVIDGEAIIYNNDFVIINKNGEFKNNRNTASGSLALLDMSIVANRKLSFIAWDIITGSNNKEYHYNLEYAEELGFTTVPAFVLDCTKIEEKEIDKINEDLLEIAKEKGIPCDGVVWRINDIAAGDAKGQTAHHFLNAVAWKPVDDEYESRLRYITYDVSRNGILTPVAVFEPIEMDDGTTIEKASLHNLSIMKEIMGDCCYAGQKIWVIKSNMIIPQITKAVKMNYGEVIAAGGVSVDGFSNGVKCPVCGAEAEIRESDNGVKVLYCPNDNCEGKLAQRIDHFLGIKGLNVKGISRKTIEKLIDWGWINGLTDVFRLVQHKTEWVSKEGFGAASVGKILLSIDAARSGAKMEEFLAAIGIPLVGRAVAKEIVKYYPTWGDFRAAVGGDWTEFEGFGPELNDAINKFDYTEADEIVENYLTFSEVENKKKSQSLENKTFCLTGKSSLGSRDKVKELIESAGGKVASSVTSKTSFLVANQVENTAKYNNAIKLGIKIINDQELMKLLGKTD